MGLRVIAEASKLAGKQGTVVVESDRAKDAITELLSAASRNLALDYAQTRIGVCGVSGSLSTYPVDATGKRLEDLTTTPAAKYRVDIPVTSKLG